MRGTRRIRWHLKALALGFAATAAFAGVASANVGTENRSSSQVEPRFEGVAVPDGFQPQLRRETQLIVRDAPDGYQPQLRGESQLVIRSAPDGYQPQLRRAGDGTEYITNADRGSFDIRDAAIGLLLGLILAAASALALGLSRGRIRMAHS